MSERSKPYSYHGKRIIRLLLLAFGLVLAVFGTYEQRSFGAAVAFVSIADRLIAFWWDR